MRSILLRARGLFLVSAYLLGGVASAHTIRESFANYGDNQGLSRQRMGIDSTLSYAGDGLLTNRTFSGAVSRDIFHDSNLEQTGGQASEDRYAKDIYGGGKKTQTNATLSATQTWRKLTETRVLASFSDDEAVHSRTAGVGASQWLWHETIQLGIDISRTLTDRPEFAVLDSDFEIINPPTKYTATGTTLTGKHLTTPTTLTGMTYTHIVSNDRPIAKTLAAEARQFIPLVNGAVHGQLARAYNRGQVTTASGYGEVDAWITELAYLQTITRTTRARVSYRYYKEDELTRAFGDELTFGSDTATIGIVQDLPTGSVAAITVPISLEARAARYLTNTSVAASMVEVGVNAKF